MSLVFSVKREKGYKNHPLYTVRMGMIQRCYHPSQPAYKDYGARGITVCQEWLQSPKAFIEWAIIAGWQPGLSLDRKENDKGYYPENCRFVPRRVNNNKRSNIWFTYNGKSQTLKNWCIELGLNYRSIHCRYKRDRTITPDRLFYNGYLAKNEYLIYYKGETKCISEWCKILGLNYCTIWGRYNRNPTQSVEKLFSPKRKAA